MNIYMTLILRTSRERAQFATYLSTYTSSLNGWQSVSPPKEFFNPPRQPPSSSPVSDSRFHEPNENLPTL